MVCGSLREYFIHACFIGLNDGTQDICLELVLLCTNCGRNHTLWLFNFNLITACHTHLDED